MDHYEESNPKPEIVIGLCGPVGTDLRGVSEKIANDLRAYRYETDSIRVSDLLKARCEDHIKEYVEGLGEDRRIDVLMNVGDHLRCETKKGAAIVPDILTEIRKRRQNFLLSEDCSNEHDRIELYNRCYIINSLKNPDEVGLLRRVYGDKFILLSIVSPQSVRRGKLIDKISQTHLTTEYLKFGDKADFLIEKDRQRTDIKFGQSISEAFPLADFFLRTGVNLEADVRRFLRILFGSQKETPTRLEFAMYEARSNALGSADLSRQVGAVVTNDKFQIVSRGCNEVPVVGGDSYWADDEGTVRDNRDVSQGRDFNAIKKIEILRELLDFLNRESVATLGNKSLDESVDQLVMGDLRDQFKHLRVSNLIEFGRMIHAEMAALMESARRGLAVEGGKMIVTTFPCHMCARHIISAGIAEVFFIEPYPKSLTAEIYRDEIAVEESEDTLNEVVEGGKRVLFKAFYGVAPRFYTKAFEMGDRKDRTGYALPFNERLALPLSVPLSRSHLTTELAVSLTGKFIPKVTDKEKIESRL